MGQYLLAPANDEVIKIYLNLLCDNGMHKEKSEVENLMFFINHMDKQIEGLMLEIKELHITLETIQNPQAKTYFKDMVESLQKTINSSKTKVNEIAENVKVTIHDSVKSFKTMGVIGLAQSLDMFNIKPALEGIKKALYFSIKKTEQGLYKVNQILSETRNAKYHLTNARLLMMGKPARIESSYQELKLNKVQQVLIGFKERSRKMLFHTTSMIKRIDTFQQKSIKQELKEIKGSKDNGKSIESFVKTNRR